MNYYSTRGDKTPFLASQAIIKGLAKDGGLFVPESFPKLIGNLEDYTKMDYKEVAFKVLKAFLDDYTDDELLYCVNGAYDNKFDTKEIAPVKKVGDEYFLELFHGKTIAFKDMALSILPYLLTTAMKKNNIQEDVVILTATSGDTGKAALAGFADVEGTGIIVFYPKGGVSHVQELQMVTQKGDNTTVIGVHGNFDDCQSAVKRMFSDEKLAADLKEKGYIFSSANSINIGRLIPQVAYYVYAYSRMVKMGEIALGDTLNFTVPTGNFGNILAGFYAKQMGVPVGKLICASNENKVLYDFFESGEYDKNREFILTSSPSMDILISSNFERLVYYSCGNDADKTAKLMSELSQNGKYKVTDEMKEKMSDFVGVYASETDVFDTISAVYKNDSYVMDTHTAVAAYADRAYKEASKDSNKSVIVSTASPYKFSRSVLKAIDEKYDEIEDDFELIKELEKISKVAIPGAVKEIMDANIRHNTVCDVNEMESKVRATLK